MGDRTKRLGRRDLLAGVVASSVLSACERSGSTPRKANVVSQTKMPTIYLPHGAGPCFFMDWKMGAPDEFDRMAAYLKGLGAISPVRPKSLLVISAHWEEPVATVTSGSAPPLLYDYSGFPPHTYELTWPAPGEPALAAKVRDLLKGAGIDSREDSKRGFDHGVFIPLKLSFPAADIPTVQLSLRKGLDPREHLAMGEALASLREEGVFIIGSGMSYHNMRGFGRAEAKPDSDAFEAWLVETLAGGASERNKRLGKWAAAPSARASHPREEHLLPLMVVAGAAGGDVGARDFIDQVMGVTVSAHRFG